MKKFLIITCLFLFLFPEIKAQSAIEIVDNSQSSIDMESMEMLSTLKIIDAKGRERIRQVSTASRKFGKTSKRLIKFTAPADVQGTAMLIFDNEDSNDDMWIYMPALRKTRRIVSTEKGKSFMGSEFTNADMSKPDKNQFDYKMLGSTTIEGKDCHKIEMSCKNQAIAQENGYHKKIMYIEKGTFLTHKMEFFDKDGKLQRTQILKDYKKQSSGKYFSFYMEMKNEQNGRKSIMITDKFQIGSNLPESNFTPAMLEK
ncbi:MAG: outer membrane lipoprotein-sorting protein [Bacteroidales bacterium]|nr:outer membrane lipoprotein-sorting protein [Bacteroidales bacterium]